MTTGRINQISIIQIQYVFKNISFILFIILTRQSLPLQKATEENLCAFWKKFLPSRLSQPGFTTFRGRLCRELFVTLSTDKPNNFIKGRCPQSHEPRLKVSQSYIPLRS